MKFKYLILVCFGILQACSSGPKRAVDFSPIDGGWLQTQIQCTQGKLNELGKRQQTNLSNGNSKTVLIVRGNLAEFTVLETNPGTQDSRCEVRWRASWIPNRNDSTLTVSDDDYEITRINTPHEFCFVPQGPKYRTHHYEIKKDELKVIFSKEYSDAFNDPICTQGQEVFIYKRIF